jgi:hypothetical protein
MKLCKEIYRADQLPIFQNKMFFSAAEAKNCLKGDIRLVQDLTTGLIFNQAFKPDLMQYDDSYQNEQAFSAVFQRHLHSVSDIILKHFKNQSLIEVGCGKAYFFYLLKYRGFDIKGIDPAYEGSDLSIIKAYFTPESGLQADGIILRHVLEHIQDPVQFLSNICISNRGRGKIYIEVPCFDWIVSHKAFFDIFYEHVNYFRKCDFNRMFDKIYESGNVFNGQYLYVIADLATIKKPIFNRSDYFESSMNHFLDAVHFHAERLKVHGHSCNIWGGASKGVIFALFMERAGVKVDLVIDLNPAKQGRYMAATGIKVCSPTEAIPLLKSGSDLFVMNNNYLNEIQELTSYNLNYISVENEIKNSMRKYL